MKKILSIVAFLAISSQAADVSPLGQTIGKSTIANLKSAGCPVVDKGVNLYTNGKMFAADPKCYEVEGLLNVIFVYNPSQVLEGVLLATKKRLFDSFNKSLSEKYKNKTAESIPFVGDKGAKWVEGDVIIWI